MGDRLLELINPLGNDMISEMKGKDLQEFLYHLNNYYLTLRDNLGFQDYITFGIELEFEHVSIENLKRVMKDNGFADPWLIRGDGTLDAGAEVSTPIFNDLQDTWKDIVKICGLLSEISVIGDNCGGHIHAGAQILGGNAEYWRRLLEVWSTYEPIIFRYSYGEFATARPNLSVYACPVAIMFEKVLQDVKNGKIKPEDIIDHINKIKRQAINFKNVKGFDLMEGNTIEYRCPNGTLDPVIWQNNVNFFISLLLYVSSSRYDGDIIQRRMALDGDRYLNYALYNEIYLQQSLELADMLFTKNIDKIYFLRQYLKAYEPGDSKFVRTKRFVA